MIKTATITYHASHNYGSMLQAYSLQKTLYKLGFQNEIINLRTLKQKKLYKYPYNGVPQSLKELLIDIKHLPFKKDLQKKYLLFEKFLKDELITTKEFSTEKELKEANLNYDCFIAGGDQIWNTFPQDFDWSFYLTFTDKKKISYSVSMGPHAEKEVSNRKRISELLNKFSNISVREEGTKEVINKICDKNIYIHIDPTLLLTTNEWKSMSGDKRIIDEEYILVYSPLYNKDAYKIALKIGKMYNIKVITSNHVIYHKPITWGLKYHLATGPKEFLNLVNNAKLVVCGSYHAILFSKIMETPFLAINGNTDNRMNTFLSRTGLMERSVSMKDPLIMNKIKNKDFIFNCNFDKANEYIEEEKKKSFDYLIKAIGTI